MPQSPIKAEMFSGNGSLFLAEMLNPRGHFGHNVGIVLGLGLKALALAFASNIWPRSVGRQQKNQQPRRDGPIRLAATGHHMHNAAAVSHDAASEQLDYYTSLSSTMNPST